MAETGTLHDAFIDELRDTYDAEKQLTKALPKLAKAATRPEAARGVRSPPRGDARADRAARAGVREPRREGARQALRRHRRHHRRRQVDHGGGLRRGDDGRVPDCRGPARRALRDGGLRHAGRLGARDGPRPRRPTCCRRTSTRRRRPTRSSRPWPRAASTRGGRAAHPAEDEDDGGRTSRRRKDPRKGESWAPLVGSPVGRAMVLIQLLLSDYRGQQVGTAWRRSPIRWGDS